MWFHSKKPTHLLYEPLNVWNDICQRLEWQFHRFRAKNTSESTPWKVFEVFDKPNFCSCGRCTNNVKTSQSSKQPTKRQCSKEQRYPKTKNSTDHMNNRSNEDKSIFRRNPTESTKAVSKKSILLQKYYFCL